MTTRRGRLSPAPVRDRISSSVLARRLVQAGIDVCLIALAWLLAFLLRFDPTIPERYATLLAESVAFVVVCWFINRVCFALSPVALAIVFFYSLTKRFTAFTQPFIGLALSVAPVGAWLAVHGRLAWPPVVPLAVRHVPVEGRVGEDEVRAPFGQGVQHLAAVPHVDFRFRVVQTVGCREHVLFPGHLPTLPTFPNRLRPARYSAIRLLNCTKLPCSAAQRNCGSGRDHPSPCAWPVIFE